MSPSSIELITACRHIIDDNIKFNPANKLVIVYDEDCNLAKSITQGFIEASHDLPNKETVLFTPESAPTLKQTLTKLNKQDAVILIQTTNFRISEYRIRLECNNNGVYVLEFSHLYNVQPHQEQTYLNALTYDQPRYQQIINRAKPILESATKIQIISKHGSIATYDSPCDKVYSNIGEIQETMGSFYPIGEFFTEALDITKVNGTFEIYAFPSLEHKTTIPTDSFQVHINDGCITSHNGPKEFEEIMTLLKTENDNQQVPIREMGFGLNKFISKSHPLGYVGSHERQNGYHVSLGLKHGVFRKKVPKTINQRFHIDMFIDVEKIIAFTPDGEKIIFEYGEYKTE